MSIFIIRAIKPKEMAGYDAIRMELLNALRKEGKDVDKDFENTVKTWNDKPTFKSVIHLSRTSAEASVETKLGGSGDALQHYQWVDQGTQDHYVPKSGSATMTFNTQYTAKTRPGSLHAGRGGPGGDRITRRGRWLVRGIAPRNFIEKIQEKRKARFVKYTSDAMAAGAKKVWK